MIEGGFFGPGDRVHQHEFRASFYGPRVPEVIGLPDPIRGAGKIHHQAARLQLQGLGSI